MWGVEFGVQDVLDDLEILCACPCARVQSGLAPASGANAHLHSRHLCGVHLRCGGARGEGVTSLARPVVLACGLRFLSGDAEKLIPPSSGAGRPPCVGDWLVRSSSEDETWFNLAFASPHSESEARIALCKSFSSDR